MPADTPHEADALLTQAINSQDVDAATAMFTEDGVFADVATGDLVVGTEALRQMFAGWLPMRPHLESDPPQVIVSGDVAIVIGPWNLETPGPDGRPLAVSGNGSSVLRRGEDGLWRYAICNPAGTALPVPSGA